MEEKDFQSDYKTEDLGDFIEPESDDLCEECFEEPIEFVYQGVKFCRFCRPAIAIKIWDIKLTQENTKIS